MQETLRIETFRGQLTTHNSLVTGKFAAHLASLGRKPGDATWDRDVGSDADAGADERAAHAARGEASATGRSLIGPSDVNNIPARVGVKV